MRRNTRRYGIELRHFDNWEGGGCRVYVNGNIARGCTAGGCGYDRGGAALANWLMTRPEFTEAVKHLTSNYGSSDIGRGGSYSLSFYNPITRKHQHRYSKNARVHVDGACGKSSVSAIVKAIGGAVEYVTSSKWSEFYQVYLPEVK